MAPRIYRMMIPYRVIQRGSVSGSPFLEDWAIFRLLLDSVDIEPRKMTRRRVTIELAEQRLYSLSTSAFTTNGCPAVGEKLSIIQIDNTLRSSIYLLRTYLQPERNCEEANDD